MIAGCFSYPKHIYAVNVLHYINNVRNAGIDEVRLVIRALYIQLKIEPDIDGVGHLYLNQVRAGDFGENAAWWMLMILAFNINAAMKRLALGESWARRRLKALRFHLIKLPGRVISGSRRLKVRLAEGHPSFKLLLSARRNISALAGAAPS